MATLNPIQDYEETDGNQSSTQKNEFMLVAKPWSKQADRVLTVYFMNRDILNSEKYKGKEITVELILDWANSWNLGCIPRFEETSSKKKADIRIKFSETESSWTMIGTYAKKVDHKDPTMTLNLFDKYCSHVHQMKSLVVHEFGHALGLGNEYQCSDFWDVLEKHIDVEKMRSDDSVLIAEYSKMKAIYGSGWFKSSPESKSSSKLKRLSAMFVKKNPVNYAVDSIPEYDPESIMQYRFDKCWLKNPDHGKLYTIAEDSQLCEKEKKYLRGLIQRESGMASEPSQADIKKLQNAYMRGLSTSTCTPKETAESSSVGTPTVTLPEVMDMMLDASAKWKNIGIALGLNQDTLQTIERETSAHDDQHCLNEVFHHWLDNSGQATWSELVKALESQEFGLEENIEKIHAKWIKPYQKVSYSGASQLSQEDPTVRVVVLAHGIKPNDIFPEDSELPVEKVQQLLRMKGQKDLATNLISRLDEVAKELN